MSVHYLASAQDSASANIAARLLEGQGWEDGAGYWRRGDDVLFLSDEHHLDLDRVEDTLETVTGQRPEVICVLSRHSAASGQQALTTHTPGNYAEARYGGHPQTLCPAAPAHMSAMYRALGKSNDLEGFVVTFEATHHGPYVEVPILYVELGSTEREWERHDAARAIARAIAALEPRLDDPVVVGVGGSHYVPRPGDLVRTKAVSVGHLIPTYALENAHDPMVPIRMAIAATPGCQGVYLDRKRIKKPMLRGILKSLEDEGIEVYRTADFADLPGAGSDDA